MDLQQPHVVLFVLLADPGAASPDQHPGDKEDGGGAGIRAGQENGGSWGCSRQQKGLELISSAGAS
jgi:hypothetical protein